MRDHRTPSPFRDDLIHQGAVLDFVITEAPIIVTEPEVESELGKGDDSQRAVRDLICAGLLRREGDSLVATRAAVIASWIWELR